MKVVKITSTKFVNNFVNCFALYIIWKIVQALGKWYLGKVPPVGVDTLVSAANLNYINRWHEFITPLGWKYIWFGGNPLSQDTTFYFLLIAPLRFFYDATGSVMHFAIFALFLFAIFSYLLFLELSKNRVMALFLTGCVLLSANFYIALVGDGDIPFWIAQAFLPLVGLLTVRFIFSHSSRYLIAAALVSGLGALGYPQGFMFSIIPFSALLLLFFNPLSLKRGERFLNCMWFLLMFFAVSLPSVLNLITKADGFMSGLAFGGGSYNFSQDQYISWLLFGLISLLWIILVVYIKRMRKYVFDVLPFVFFLALGFIAGSKFHYTIPFAASLVVAIVFYQLQFLFGKLEFFERKKTVFLGANICFLVFILVYFSGVRAHDLVGKLESVSTPSKQVVLDKSIFGDSFDRNRRIYSADPSVNLSLSLSSDMPLAGGIVKPAIGSGERWGLFWLESAFASELNMSEKLVDQNAKFLLDWNAIYYFVRPNAANVADSVFFDTRVDRGDLSYFKIKEEFVTPILAPSNASNILHIGDSNAYEILYRFLGMRNLNSRKIVVANNSRYIDDFSASDLAKFDAIILYKYDYHNRSKAWGIVEKYLKGGGKVYIDTGPEGKEAAASKLPEFFPIKKTVREDIGVNWDVAKFDEKLTEGVDFNAFSPLDFDGEAWNVSHPPSDSDLNSGAHLILKNNDKIIAAYLDVGLGKIIWTGFNLPYHIIRENNEAEAGFFYNLLTSLVDLSEKNVGGFDYQWISPERRSIKTGGARAVLFKEQDYEGWQVKSDVGKKLKIYKAGPTFPGFMYVPFEKSQLPDSIVFSYGGQLMYWVYSLISILGTLFLLIKIIKYGSKSIIEK